MPEELTLQIFCCVSNYHVSSLGLLPLELRLTIIDLALGPLPRFGPLRWWPATRINRWHTLSTEVDPFAKFSALALVCHGMYSDLIMHVLRKSPTFMGIPIFLAFWSQATQYHDVLPDRTYTIECTASDIGRLIGFTQLVHPDICDYPGKWSDAPTIEAISQQLVGLGRKVRFVLCQSEYDIIIGEAGAVAELAARLAGAEESVELGVWRQFGWTEQYVGMVSMWV